MGAGEGQVDDMVLRIREDGRPSTARILGVMLKFGVSAFGGPAMLPLMRKRFVDHDRLVDEETFRTGLSICQALPGATGMQLAAYLGLRLRGLQGALAGYIGFALPSFLFITVLSAVYFRYRDLHFLDPLYTGLKVVVLGIIVSAAIDFLGRYARTWKSRSVAAGSGILLLAGVGPIPILIASAVLGIFLFAEISGRQPSPEPVCLPLGRVLGLALVALAFFAGAGFLNRTLLDLALSMAKVDLFAFGGFGAFPIMHHEVVSHQGWMTEQTFLDGIALGQVTPGPIILSSAFVGYALDGFLGAFVAAVAVFTPSFFILLLAVPFCDRLLASPTFRRALAGILPTLGGLIGSVGASFALSLDWSPGKAALALAAFLALRAGVDVLWVVLAGAGVSFLLF